MHFESRTSNNSVSITIRTYCSITSVSFRDFVKVCGNAINLNELLIKPDQQAYHDDMKERYEVLKIKMADYVGSVGFSFSCIHLVSEAFEL